MFNPSKKPLSFAFAIEMNNRHKMTMPERLEKFESIQEGLPMTGPVSLSPSEYSRFLFFMHASFIRLTYVYTQKPNFFELRLQLLFLYHNFQVNLKTPELQLVLIEDYPPATNNKKKKAEEMERVSLGRFMCAGQRHLIREYAVTNRLSVGNTRK